MQNGSQGCKRKRGAGRETMMLDDSGKSYRMLDKLKYFERGIIYALIILMVIVVGLSTIRLGWRIVEELMKPPFMLLNIDQLFSVFGFFLMILIGMELLESLRAYIREDQIHVEVVFTIALIAVARKVVTLDMTKIEPLTLIGIAFVLLALAVGYYLIKMAHRRLR